MMPLLLTTLAGTLVCALVVGARVRRARAARELLFTQPEALADFALDWWLLADVCAVLGGLIAVADLAQIVAGFGMCAGSRRAGVLSLVVINLAAAWAMFAMLQELRRAALAVAAITLLTLGLGLLPAVFLPGSCLAGQLGLPVRASAVAIASAVLLVFWCWLGGVWHQQLDNGRAWTTAGWLCTHIDRVLVGTGIAGLVMAWSAGAASMVQVPPVDHPGSTAFALTLCAHVLVGLGLLLVWLIRRRHVLLLLACASGLGMIVQLARW